MDVDHVAFVGPAQVRRQAHALAAIRTRSARSPAARAVTARRHVRRHRRLRRHGRRPGRGGGAPPLRAGGRRRMAQRPARLLVPGQPAALPGPAAGARRAEAVGREPGRDRAAAPGRGRRHRRARAKNRAQPAAPVGGLPDARLPQDRRSTSTCAWCKTVFEHLTEGDGRLPEDWIASQFSPARPHRRRDRRPGRPAGQCAHPGLRRQPARLAGRPRPLAGPHARAGGPPLRHPAREADAALHRPAHQRPDARPEPARGAAGRRRRRRGGDGRGPLRRPPARRRLRAGRAAPRRWRTRPCARRPSGRWRRRSRGGWASWPPSRTRPSPCSPTAWSCGAARRRGSVDGDRPFAPRVRLLGELGPGAGARAGGAAAGGLPGGRGRPAAGAAAATGGGRRRGPRQGPGARPGLSPGRGRRRDRAERGGGRGQGPEPGRAAGAAEPGRALRRLLPVPAGAPGAGPRPRPSPAAFAGRWPPATGARRSTWSAPCPRRSRRPRPWPSAASWPSARLAVPVEQLERLDALLRAAPQQGQGALLSDQAHRGAGLDRGRSRGGAARPRLRPCGQAARPVSRSPGAGGATPAMPKRGPPAAARLALRRPGRAQGQAAASSRRRPRRRRAVPGARKDAA